MLQARLVFLLSMLMAPCALAQPAMNVQGAFGGGTADGPFTLRFAIYDAAQAGNELFVQVEPDVDVVDGVFDVALGDEPDNALSPAVFADHSSTWLGIQVVLGPDGEGPEPELDRRPVGAVAHAFVAEHAITAGELGCSGCIGVGHLSAEVSDLLASVGAVQPEDLPASGLNEVSNDLLTNQFVDTFASAGGVPILDYNPDGVSDIIIVQDVGLAEAIRVSVSLTNSDVATITVVLTSPAGDTYTLYAEDGPGTTVEGTWPAPNPVLDGDLSTWNGQSPAGPWTLTVTDDGFVSGQVFDGELTSWSIEVDTLSNQKVAATGDLHVDGDLVVQGKISGPGGVAVGEGDGTCGPANAGTLHYDPVEGSLFLCNGEQLLRVMACSAECPDPSTVGCGEAVTDGCSTPCGGTGTALNTVQCLVQVSSTVCGDPVVDGCGNSCGLTGTALNGGECDDPSAVTCGVPISDSCGNPCPGGTGTLCAAGNCVAGTCQAGDSEDNPAVSCSEARDTGGTASGTYWLKWGSMPSAIQVYCDQVSDFGTGVVGGWMAYCHPSQPTITGMACQQGISYSLMKDVDWNSHTWYSPGGDWWMRVDTDGPVTDQPRACTAQIFVKSDIGGWGKTQSPVMSGLTYGGWCSSGGCHWGHQGACNDGGITLRGESGQTGGSTDTMTNGWNQITHGGGLGGGNSAKHTGFGAGGTDGSPAQWHGYVRF